MKAPDLNHLFLEAPVAICIVSGTDYKVELVNERMLQFLGRTSDIVGKPLQQTLTEIREQGLISILEKVRTSKQSHFVSNFPAVILINGERKQLYFSLIFKPYFMDPEETEPSGIFCVAHNVTEAVLAQQKLEEEKQRTALALETGGLGILSTNWQEGTVTADKRAREIFGFEGEQSFDAFLSRIHPDDRQLREEAIREGDKHGSFNFEVRLLFPDGSIRWIHSRGMIKKNSDGQLVGSFGLIQDITAQKEFALTLHEEVEQRTAELEVANKTLRQLNEELLRSNANLEEFARAASHDLKEPVRKMQVFASRLKETLSDRLNEEEKDVFRRMERAAERMGLLVDDLLEYAHLGGVQGKTEAIDLNEKLSRILSDLELMISEKGAFVEIDKLPVIKGQRRQIQQLFQNLLTNALKYSRKDVAPHVRITSKVIKSEEVDERVAKAIFKPGTSNKQSSVSMPQYFHQIEVTDNGIGFPPEDAEKIFQVFTRLHGKDEYVGTGIGLSIAKKVVENHNGYIYATGRPGIGATFTVLFPAEGN